MTTQQMTAKEAAFEELCLARFWFHTIDKVEDFGDGTQWTQKPLWKYMNQEHPNSEHFDTFWFDTDALRGYKWEYRDDVENRFADMAPRIQQQLQSRCADNGFVVSVRVEAFDSNHLRRGDIVDRRGGSTTYKPSVRYTKTSLRLTFHKPA